MSTSPYSILRGFVFALLAVVFVHPALSQTPQVKIGSLDLTIGGVQATVTPAKPVIPKNIASGVQVVVTQNGQQLSASQVAQYLGGPFQLAAEFSGPGLSQTVEVPQTPPSPNSLVINLPAVTTSGNYTLSNLRFLVNGSPVFDVSPSVITVQVIDQVLVTSVQTQPLTLAQIQQMGVVLNSSSYTGFQFNIGLQLSSQTVNISFPVVFDQNGVPVPQPLSPPQVSPTGVAVPLPIIVPVLLQGSNGTAGPTITLGDGTVVPVKIPSVIVIPGNVGYLKQFFSAQLYVSNGAPAGSNLTVDNISGAISLPVANDGNPADAPLALPLLTSGPQSLTENVLGPDPNGDYTVASLNPGDTGQAQWTIQGNQEGYYTINFNINATLEGLPTGPYDLTGTAMGGVLVRNPYFDMTFTVPGVVRKGELFNVFTTVSNISQVAANNLTVNFNQNSLSGVTLVSPPSPVIPTLNAGDSTTLTFQFQSLQTGQVVASYLDFNTSNGTTGNLNFTLGIYANGTPMSPDTLVLPSSVDNLPNDVVDAAMRVLGQAWSVATAPSLPANVLPTTKTVVTEKALALSEAGLRVSLGEPLPGALRDLGTDFFGGSPSGSPVDLGFDQVLRTTPAGENFVSVLGANLAQPAIQAGGASAYELQLAQLESSGPNFLSFSVGSGTSAAPVSVAIVDGAGNQIVSTTPGGGVVGGAIFPLGSSGGVPYLGLITQPTYSPYTLLLTGQSNGSADISISIPSGSGTVIRASLSGVTVVAGQQMRVVADLTNPSNLVLQVDTNGDGSFATSVPMNVQTITPPGPTFISATVIGPETVSQAGPFGLNAVMLFDRIVDSTTSATPANYTIPNNSVLSASKQLSGRLVFANLSQPEGPYVPTTWTVSGVEDQRGVVGPTGTVTVQSFLQDPGAVVTGRVLNPDGSVSTTAMVTYENSPYDPGCAYTGTGLLGLAATTVSSTGVYQFRYVHQDQCGGPFAMATTDPSTGAVRQVSTYVRAPGQQMVIDLALLGQGSVAGTVKDLSGNPVYNAQVAIVSVTDPQIGASAYTDANGNYVVNGITVGAVTVTAAKGASLGNNAGNIERAGTTAVVNVTLNGGAVNIAGTVTQQQGSAVTPVPGAPVVYYLTSVGTAYPLPVGVAITASDGSYAINAMPTGPYLIIASLNTQLSASQTGVAAAGQNLSIPLEIVVPVAGTVNGKVTFPNGTGAAGVVVFQGTNGVLSNPDGTYTLTGVPVLPSQSQTITARTTDGTRSGYASVVVNSATTPVNGANITLSGLGNAQFTVLDATGKPVPNQQVTIPTFGCQGISQTTNASGVALFTGLPVGSVHVIALSSQGNFQDLASGTATITSDGTTGFATLQFNGSGTVTGSVIDPNSKPVLGAIVQLTSNYVDPNYCILSQGVTQSIQTDSSGTFQFTQVNVGKVGVSASQSFYPTPVGAQGTLTANGQTLNFPPLQLQNSTAGVLSGTIFMPDGVTPAGAGVQVTVNGPLPNVTVNTDANGNYQFAAILPQGSYTLSVSDPVSGGVNQMTIYLRAGQNMTQNLRMLGTATVNVTVVDGAGVPVSQAFVTLTENTYPFANFTGSLDASNQGVLPFPNVFEGSFSVQVTDSFGRGGRASGTIPQGTTSVNVQVQLTTTGSVQGHYYRPDGVTPIPNANVQLTANGVSIGQFTSLSTGDVGSYSFQYVPAGPVELKAQDPLTGYSGIAAGTITTQGQVLTLDVIAQGLDTIQGLVTSDGNPQPGAMVTVVSGTFQASTEADSNGMYLMQGVPEGVIVVTASLGNGYLSGTASAPISGDGNTLTLNVALRNSGTVAGQVVQYDGVTAAPTSTVTINVGGVGGGTETTTTDAQGNFTLQNVPSGAGTISAQVLGGIDQASQPISVAAGATTNVKVQLNGTGVVSGIALDSSGNPTAGTINLIGTGTFPYYLTLTAASNGTFSVPQVLAGPYTAKLSANIGGFTLYGTTTGSILPAQTTQITVQVQSSGTITGTVLRPDGVTPAVGANVTIQLLGPSQSGSITLQVQSDGTFTAVGVPLGTFSVLINDPSTNGIAALEGQSIATNAQVVNLGMITLDGSALSVVSSNPANGATGVGVTQALTVTFSEALASPYGIFVMNGTSNLNISPSLSSDGRTVTLQGQLPDGIPLTINVTTQVTDVFGRQLLQPQVIQFTTVDLTPPYVVSVSPVNGAIQVPVTASVVATFNKALSTTAQPANVITLSGNGSSVTGTTALTASNVLTFTPSTPLASNTLYTVNENGAVSFGGNVQTIGFMSSFASPETSAPLLQLSSPANGGYVNTPTPTILILYSDALSGINTASAALSVDGQAAIPIVSSTSMSFTPSTTLANGSHTISASVQNNAGVMGALSASFIVDTSSPSVAVLTGVTTNQVLKGQIAISASATDSISGIAKINVFVDGVLQATLPSPTFAGILDTTKIADGPHSFTVQAVSNAGNTGPVSTAIQAYIENVPLSVSITSPTNGAPFKGTVTVTAVPSEPVQSISFTLGTQTVTATASPYAGTLSVAGVPDGPQTITATATDFVGSTATTTVTITVMQTPPAAPNGNLIFAEPPNNGLSLVHGLPGAVGSGLLVTITDTVSHATTSTAAGSDGSFATNLAAAVNDTLSLTAIDVVGNVSAATLITVRSTPSLPPSAGNTSLVYQGDLVDRVGLTPGAYTPDGLNDAVFTLSLDIGANITRTISYITLQGNGQTRSTQAGSVPLGVAADTGSPLLNSASGPISFPITSGATLTLFAGDAGFILAGATYTATAVFTDGSQFVGSYTIVAPANRQYVAHSATITASPATVTVNGTTPGTTALTITNILDINGNVVPDGAMIALSAANMASNDPTGNGIVSAGGTIVGGAPATNNTNFQVFTILNGTVTATYSSQPVTPTSIMGALSVIQMQASDSNGNVLGTQAVSTLDLNIRASTDQAIIAPVPSSLFGDRADRRSQFTIQVTNGSGTPVPDGTPVLVSAASCAGLTPQSGCISSAGGQILGGASAASGSSYALFTTSGGEVQGTYSSSGVAAGDLQLSFATIQVLPSNASGSYTSRNVIGTATIAITGAGLEEIAVTPNSVPYVFPVEPVTILVHHEHDMRANLAPNGSNVIVTAGSCNLITSSGGCVYSAGGSIVDGTPSPNNSSLKYYTIEQAQATATYTAQNASSVPNTGQANLVNIQVQMADDQGNQIDRYAVGVAPVELLGPGNAVGNANPASILGDGGIHTSTVTFTPILDAYGNTIPDGSDVIATATSCAGITSTGGCVYSAGGQVTNGTASPSGSGLSVLTVQNGSVVVNYADQSVISAPGQIQTANVQLMPSDGNGDEISRTVIGTVPVQIAGLTSATGTASPASVYADGSDQRTTITVNNFRDASGNPVPDGTQVGATATNCDTTTPSGGCNYSEGGVILGSDPASFDSSTQIFTVTNGQVSFPYSAEGVSVPTGQQTATVQIEAVTPQGAQISRTAIATVNVQLLSLGSGSVTATPASILADGASHTSRIVISNLLESDGATPVPNGAKVGLTVGNCTATTPQGGCIYSAGGSLSSAGTSPGDGTAAPNNSAFAVFTVAGRQVQAIYSDSGLTSGVNQTQSASIAVVPADPNGNVLTRYSYASGTIPLQGITSATASGPSSISLSAGGTATITYSGIKDAAGNTVPDGTSIAVTAVSCASTTPQGGCNYSAGGTIVGGTTSPSDSRFQVFTTQGGAITATYSPSGASVGTATIQAVPAQPGGALINHTSLFGGTWAITVTN